MLHLFDERSFKQRVERTYQNPLAAEQSWMCILYLVFAVGLQLRSASPQPSPKDAAILKRLLSDKFDRSELFYLGARHLKDSASGIEDGDFASIQALLLMTLYMLSVGKRNTAWAYIGTLSVFFSFFFFLFLFWSLLTIQAWLFVYRMH